MKDLFVTHLITGLLDKVGLKDTNSRCTAVGVATATAGTAAASTAGLDTLEGQVTAAVSAVVSLVFFVLKKRGE
jgi:hypothetical protein